MTDNVLHILLIEDNPVDQAMLREYLSVSSMSAEVTFADSLAEANRAAQMHTFGLILLDLSLPDSHGMETLLATLGIFPSTPIIVLTGLSDEEMGNEAVRAGAEDYLVKGQFTSDGLCRSIRYALERHAVRQALCQARDHLEEQVQERTADLAITIQELKAEVRQRLRVEAELLQANQIMRMASECNEVLVRIDDEITLIREICEIITKVGGYRMAWVGYARNDAEKSVHPVAAMGFDDDYLEKARISWADTQRGRGPTGTSIRTGQVKVSGDFLTDPDLAPWRAAAIDRGFRSSIAIPLRDGSEIFGALTIYSAQPNVFDEAQVKVLTELADDLAFGILALRTRSALRESRQRLQRVLHSAPVIIWAADLSGQFTLADGKLDVLGLMPEQIVGRHMRDIVGEHPEILGHFEQAARGEQVTAEVGFCGMILESSYSPLRDENDHITGVICVSTDITDRRRVEMEVLEASEREQRRIGRDLHDGIQGSLAGIGFMLGAHRDHLLQPDSSREELAAEVNNMAGVVKETLSQTRGLAKGLCPVDMNDTGLMAALEQLASNTKGMFRTDCRFLCSTPVSLSDETAAMQLYYIAQEAVNNALKHADAKSIVIRLECKDEGSLVLTIEDDGRGMPKDAGHAGMGLRTMNYRARLAGATLAIRPGEKCGTIVECIMPWRGHDSTSIGS